MEEIEGDEREGEERVIGRGGERDKVWREKEGRRDYIPFAFPLVSPIAEIMISPEPRQ